MVRNRTVSAVLAGVLIMGCGNPDSGSRDGPSVGLLTSGPVSDAGWHAGAYEGLQLIGESLGFRISHQQTRSTAELDEAFLSYAEDGYDLVFGHGFEFQDAATRAGKAYPEVTFVISAGSRPSANVIPLIFQLEEASYLAGMAAGGVTTSGTIGMVGGQAIPSAKGTFLAFEAGVKAVNPEATVLETFTGSWEDVSAAKEAAAAQLRRGADVLIHNVDAASFGLFQSVREARAQGRNVWALGMNGNQNAVAPDVILGSAAIDMPGVFLQVATDWQNDALEPGARYTGIAGGAVDFIPNPDLTGVLSEELLALIGEARAGIVSGALEIPRIRFVEDEPASP